MSETVNAGDIYIKPSRDIAARRMLDEMVIMSVKDSKVFSLNPVATRIWSAADGATTLREIVARTVVSEFDVDADTAYQDAVELVEELAQEGILLLADHPIGQESA
jgi:Coenzyme PQQ synthesis protein D (PqqD)